MNNHRYILEPYNGMKSRYHCPECNHREKTFSRYIDTKRGEYVADHVGRCNREDKCGYHYTPSQYFKDNPFDINRSNVPFVRSDALRVKNERTEKTHYYIDKSIFQRSLSNYDKNTFTKYLTGLFGEDVTKDLIDKYHIGTSKHWPGSTVFWQVDTSGNIRAGKIMLYNKTGHRVKEPFNHITWVHKVLKIEGYELKQALFGAHLLKDNDLPIAIIESEKTACIASIYLPQFLWLACGQLNGLNAEKCKVLEGQSVILYPDLSVFEKWKSKANDLQNKLPGTRFLVSDFLEKNAPENDREEGYDLADYLIRFDISDFRRDKELDYPKEWDDCTPDYTDRWQLLNHLLNEAEGITQQFRADKISGDFWQTKCEGILTQAKQAGITNSEFGQAAIFWN